MFANRRRDAARPGDRLRRRFSSPSGFVSVGLVVALSVGSVAVALGQGASRVLMDLGDGASWLPTNPRGAVTLVDGASGRPTAEVQLSANDDAELRVVELDGDVYVLDVATGVLTRIDGRTLQAPKSVATGGASSVLGGIDVAYVIDAENGTVRVLDEQTLEPVGDEIDLGGPVVGAESDCEGVAHVMTADGSVVRLAGRDVAPPVQVLESGAGASLTVADCLVYAVDPDSNILVEVTPDGPGDVIDLPFSADADELLAPRSARGVLTVTAPGLGEVVSVDLKTSRATLLSLPSQRGAQWGPAVRNGDLLYVPEYGSGRVIVVDTATSSVRAPISVAQAGVEFDLFVKDGIVFGNDPTTDRGFTADDTGAVREVTKFDAEVAATASQPAETPEDLKPLPQSPQEQRENEFPSLVDAPAPPTESEFPALVEPPSAPEPPSEPAPPAAGPAEPGPAEPEPAEPGPPAPPAPPVEVPVPGPGGPPGEPGPPAPQPEPEPAPEPEPEPEPAPEPGPPADACPDLDGNQPPGTDCNPVEPAPGQPTVTDVSTGDRTATVSFAPGVGGQVDSYALQVVENGAVIQPKAVTQSGDLEFTVEFASCKNVTFSVVAKGPSSESASAPSAEQVTCVPAGAVGNLQVTERTDSSISIAWDAPSGSGPFTYEIRYGDGPQATDKRSFKATGLQSSKDYTFQVVATGPAGSGGEKSVTASTKAPPKPPTVTIRECRDGKQLPGGGHRAFYGETCNQGSPTGRTFQVLSDTYAGYEPLYRYERLNPRDAGYMNEFYLKPGGPPDDSWGNGKVIGYVGGGGGPQIKAHRWDYWDGSYSWKAWSFGTEWPGFQPGATNRATVDAVFKAE